MDKGIIILGMHRSGTSCLAGMLQSAGFDSGGVDEWMPDNNKGNRENTKVVRLNDEILRHGGGSWSNPHFSLAPKAEHIQKRDSLTREFKGFKQPWMFKDPRTLLTLPFWLEAFESATLLGIFRHPIAVANSLSVRNSMSLKNGLELWQNYNRILLNIVESNEIPLLHFNQDLPGLIEATADILATLFATEIETESINPEKMQGFVQPDLIHQVQVTSSSLKQSLDQLGVSGYLASNTIEIWNTLLEYAVNLPESSDNALVNTGQSSQPVNDFIEAKQFDLALEALEVELANNQERTDLWQQGISVIKQIGDSKLLINWLGKCLKVSPDHPTFLFEQAKLNWQSGKHEEGLSMMEYVVQLTPGWEPALKLLSSWYFDNRQWEKAANLLHEITNSKQINAEVLNFAQIFVDTGGGYNEKDSIRHPVFANGQETELFFDLSGFEKIKAIRFDPLNDFTIVRLNQVSEIYKNGSEAHLQVISSNGQLANQDTLGFSTKDSQIILKTSPSVHYELAGLTVRLQYLHTGTGALLQCHEQLKNQLKGLNSEAVGKPSMPIAASQFKQKGNIAEILQGWELDRVPFKDASENKVLLQGWALPKENDKLNIVIQYDGLTRSYDRNVERPDVVASQSENSALLSRNSTCGFCFKVPKKSIIKVGVESDMRIYWIETVHT